MGWFVDNECSNGRVIFALWFGASEKVNKPESII